MASTSICVRTRFDRWLAGHATACPASQREDRDPTPRDVRWAIHHLDGYCVEVAIDGTRWRAVIAGVRRTYDRSWLDAVGFTGDKHLPAHISFDGNAPHAILGLTERLAPRRGALVLIPDDAPPAVGDAGTDINSITFGWQAWS